MTIDNDNLDRVAEGYKGELGEKRMKDIQKRFDWLISKVDGKKLLDVGCSQGIFAIKLFEAKNGVEIIVGIDSAEESIDYANDFLSKQSSDVQEAIKYINGDFLKMDENETFDTIIIAEVLEHLDNPKSFISKSYKLLPSGGKLVITVPFAINDFPDHKRTYYFADLHEQLLPEFKILEYEILGEWIGIVAVKDLLEGQEINLELLKNIEQGFFTIERSLRDKITAKDQRISRLIGAREKFETTREKLIESRRVTKETKKQLKTTKEELKMTKKELRVVKRELEKIKNKNEEILNSTSWKVTKPLRRIKNYLS